LGKYKEALDEFDLAVKYNSKFADAYYNKGLVYQEQYDKGHNAETLKNAAACFKKSTDINPDHPYAHLKLANAYQTLGQYEQAIIRYRLALEINPDLTDAWNNLAALYTKTGQTLKAQQALNHALATDEDSAQAHINLGMNYLSDGNVSMAINEFNSVIKKEPTNELAYFNVGYAYYTLALSQRQSSKDEQAKAAFAESNRAYESALKLHPAYVEAAFNIGYNHYLMQDTTQAITWYHKALAINANFAPAHYGLGQIYQASGKNAEAAKEYCQVIKLNPIEFTNEMNTIKETAKSLGGCK
jgi:tetratricopeptide (TPR) repeat protein